MRRFQLHRDHKIEWLASLPWWQDLDRENLAQLAAAGDRVQIPAGQQFMRDGEMGREAAIIIDGEVEVVRDGDVIARLGPGEVVGELSLLHGDHRNADVRTTVTTEAMVFSVTGLRRVLAAVAPVREQILASARARVDG